MIIPCLDIIEGKIAKQYEQQCEDDVVFLHITVTSENCDTIYDFVEHASRELTIALAVGGSIRTNEAFSKILTSGADKVFFNSPIIATREFIR
jgi:cyclase